VKFLLYAFRIHRRCLWFCAKIQISIRCLSRTCAIDWWKRSPRDLTRNDLRISSRDQGRFRSEADTHVNAGRFRRCRRQRNFLAPFNPVSRINRIATAAACSSEVIRARARDSSAVPMKSYWLIGNPTDVRYYVIFTYSFICREVDIFLPLTFLDAWLVSHVF
jgi:hypothetical protein